MYVKIQKLNLSVKNSKNNNIKGIFIEKTVTVYLEVGRDFQFDVNPVRNTMQMHTIFLEPILKSTLINHSTSYVTFIDASRAV